MYRSATAAAASRTRLTWDRDRTAISSLPTETSAGRTARRCALAIRFVRGAWSWRRCPHPLSASDATASQLPPLEASIFPADVHGLERALHLHVGSNAALWFGFGKYSPDGGCVAGVPCEIGAGTAVTGSLIDVPAAHISIAGAITAQHVTLALGNGHTVTISPPESSPATVFPGGQDPIRAANLLEVRVIDERTLESLTVDGLVETLASVVVKGPFSSKNGLIGVDGDIEFQNGANGFGSVFAEGNITVRGTISFHTPLLYALASRTGNVNLFGTG